MCLPAQNPEETIEPMMLYMGKLAREAAGELALASTDAKNGALGRMAAALEAGAEKILMANSQDIGCQEEGARCGLSRPAAP